VRPPLRFISKHQLERELDLTRRGGHRVIPKDIRRDAGILPGMPLDVRVREGRIEIESAPFSVRLEKRGRFLVAVPQEQVPVLTSEAVNETRLLMGHTSKAWRERACKSSFRNKEFATVSNFRTAEIAHRTELHIRRSASARTGADARRWPSSKSGHPRNCIRFPGKEPRSGTRNWGD